MHDGEAKGKRCFAEDRFAAERFHSTQSACVFNSGENIVAGCPGRETKFESRDLVVVDKNKDLLLQLLKKNWLADIKTRKRRAYIFDLNNRHVRNASHDFTEIDCFVKHLHGLVESRRNRRTSTREQLAASKE